VKLRHALVEFVTLLSLSCQGLPPDSAASSRAVTGCPGAPPPPRECARVICLTGDGAWDYVLLPAGTVCNQIGQCDGVHENCPVAPPLPPWCHPVDRTAVSRCAPIADRAAEARPLFGSSVARNPDDAAADGCLHFAYFERGALVEPPGGCSFLIGNTALDVYRGLRFSGGVLGNIVGDQTPTADRTSVYVPFEQGRIYERPPERSREPVAYATYGDVFAYFLSQGGEASFGIPASDLLDIPSSAAHCAADNRARSFQWFEGAVIEKPECAPARHTLRPRSVLDIPYADYPGAHYPAFPTPGTTCHRAQFLEADEAPWEWTPMNGQDQADQYGYTMAVAGYAHDPHLSGGDLLFTHPFGNDFEFMLAPDPQFFHLLGITNGPLHTADQAFFSVEDEFTQTTAETFQDGLSTPGVLGVEMESGMFPLEYQPAGLGRVAVWGRWIEDCGHTDFHKEIHPPLMMATATPVTADRTTAKVVSRPYLVDQVFGTDHVTPPASNNVYDGAMRQHIVYELTRAVLKQIDHLDFITPLRDPFRWEVMDFVVRPPTGRPAGNRLLVSYHFTTRPGVAVSLDQPESGAVGVHVTMTGGADDPPPPACPGQWKTWGDVKAAGCGCTASCSQPECGCNTGCAADVDGARAEMHQHLEDARSALCEIVNAVCLGNCCDVDYAERIAGLSDPPDPNWRGVLVGQCPAMSPGSPLDRSNVVSHRTVGQLVPGAGVSVYPQPYPIYGSITVEWAAPHCTNGVRDAGETDVDCGGSDCQPCATGQACANAGDCAIGACNANSHQCVASSCQDGVRDAGETDVDCGGPCAGCATGRACSSGPDCASGFCSVNTHACVASQCQDGVRDGGETGVDCGGPCRRCPSRCPPGSRDCGDGQCAPARGACP
jgi:hypothetical protein